MSKDLIYREDAIKAVRSVTELAVPFLSGINATLPIECEIALQAIPPADRPQGEWIEHERAEEVNGMLISNYECPCCHEWELKASNYCPDCGCRNRKE